MNFEFNKIAGAVLGTAVAVMAVNIMAAVIYDTPHVEEPGYVIAVADSGAGDGAGSGQPEVAPIADRLQVADLGAGETQGRKCIACHTFVQGGPNRVGPNLWNVVGGPYAHIGDFGYSEAIQTAAAEGRTWTFDELDGYLENPRGFLPGTAMAFAGIRRPDERADMILFLRSLSNDPVPLPAVTVVEAEEAAPETPEAEAAATEEIEQGQSEEEMADDDAAAEEIGDEASTEEEAADETAAEEAGPDADEAEVIADEEAAEDAPAEGTDPAEEAADEAAAEETPAADEADSPSGG
ncbi:c-type cytochrome [Bauldia sp.]|uniref:c-type cytochrome n=1 Tax=Bauldia sp. TaxID=2575872 RepID=UPI003BA9DF37